MGEYEDYARRYGTLHPACIAVVQPWFDRYSWSAQQVKVRLVPDWFGSVGARGSPTAVAVFGRTLYCIAGVLDADHRVRSNLWSWRQVGGIANWCHEVFHVYQYERDGFWRLYGLFAAGIVRSLLSGQLYDHTKIAPEREAMQFEQYVYAHLLTQRLLTQRQHEAPNREEQS